jgi:hypothetical protein
MQSFLDRFKDFGTAPILLTQGHCVLFNCLVLGYNGFPRKWFTKVIGPQMNGINTELEMLDFLQFL